MSLVGIGFAWWAGCDGEPAKGRTGDDDDDATTPTTGDDLRGLTGSIAVVEYPPYAGTKSTLRTAWGVFVDAEPEVVNLAECLFLDAPCLTEWPGEGDSADQVLPPSDLTALDAGARIRVGSAWLERVDDDPAPAYTGEGFTLGDDRQLRFDGDLAGFGATDVFELPAELAGLSPDPAAEIALGATDDLTLRWTAGGPGEVYTRWPGLANVVHTTLADSGEAVLGGATTFGLRAPLDATWITLARATHTEVDANGNDVAVDVIREQLWFVNYEATDGWIDLTGSPSLTETCGGTTPLPDGRYYGSVAEAADDHDLGAGNPLTGYPTPGRDLAFPVDLAEGDTLEVDYRQVWLDAAVYVFDANCTGVLAAVDDRFESEPEVLHFLATAGGRYHVVLDGYSSGERFAVETRTLLAQ
jgi:hypothetical protein